MDGVHAIVAGGGLALLLGAGLVVRRPRGVPKVIVDLGARPTELDRRTVPS